MRPTPNVVQRLNCGVMPGKWRMVVGLLAGISAVDLVADDVTFVSTISACGCWEARLGVR